jgi:hypothetical protein
MRIGRPLVLAVLATTFVVTAALAASPVEVRDAGDIKEWHGSAIDGWFAWQANSTAHPRVFKVYVKADGSTRLRVPFPGTAAEPTLVATGPRAGRVVFQVPDLHKGDIRFYDPATETVQRVPRAINSPAREDHPAADGDYLTFQRIRSSGANTILYRFSSKSSTVVGHRMTPGQLNGDYAVYFRCTSATCDVMRYRISEDRFTTMPAAASGRANYWPAVMADGTVYYVQGSRTRCGRNTKILRFHAGTVTTVAKLPDGTELATMEARTVNGSDQLLVTEITCGGGGTIRDTGIYSVAI